MERFRNISPFHLLCALLGGVVLLFILAPLAGMVFHSAPALPATACDPEVVASIWLTLWTAMAATLGFGVLAIPLAWLLARHEFPFKRLLCAALDLPVVVPHSAAGIALLGFIGRHGLLGRAGESVGLQFVSRPAGIVLAMAFVSLPFLINAARDGFAAVPRRYEQAAMALGAGPLRVFFTVSLPLAWRAILSGLVMMWARGMSEFGAVIIVAYHPMITPVLLYERFGAYGLAYARPVAALFLIICVLVFAALRMLAGRPVDAAR